MMFGSGPMARRLAAYRAGQPPRTPNRAAMPDRVSPLRTTYLVVWRVAVTGAAAALDVLVRMTSVVLPAVRVFAWAWWADPFMPTVTRMIARMLQASTTHADLVHVRMVVSLSFQGDQRRTLLVRTPKARTGGKESDLGGRYLWQVGAPDQLRGGTTHQPQQDQGEEGDQGSAGAVLHSAAAVAADAAIRTAAACAATRSGRQAGKRRGRRHGRTGARESRCRRPERGQTGGQSGRGQRCPSGGKQRGHARDA